jgi:thiol:disulfide interchange protein
MHMDRKLFWMAPLAVWLVLMTGDSTLATNKTIEWHNYQDGMQRGKFENKKVFLHFYADWCMYCKKMEQSTFKDPEVIDALNQDYIPVRVNTDLDPETTRLYGVRPIPDTWFIYENGEPMGNRPGFISVDQMKVLLKLINKQSAPAN